MRHYVLSRHWRSLQSQSIWTQLSKCAVRTTRAAAADLCSSYALQAEMDAAECSLNVNLANCRLKQGDFRKCLELCRMVLLIRASVSMRLLFLFLFLLDIVFACRR